MNYRSLVILLGVLYLATPAAAQQIILDKLVKAGELTLFPELNDPNSYYFLPDQPRLAVADNGKPKFSFLRYVENTRSGADEAEAQEGEGGGIVHAVIELGVTPQQLRVAERELRKKNSNGQIAGSVMFRGGTVALISSFADPNGEMTEQVLGIGAAPILDGQQVAVSIQLSKKGALILWESFQTPTPDMSISFEMELGGFRSPRRALIEADFEQVYEHKSFDAGVSTPFLAGEIKAAYDDLVRSGAIKVTQVGPDEKMEELMTSAYNKLLQIMFDPVGGTGTPSVEQLTAQGAQGNSMLDRATRLLADARSDARAENERIRAENARRPSPTTTVSNSDAEEEEEDEEIADEESEDIGKKSVARKVSNQRAAQVEVTQLAALRPVAEVPLPTFAVAVSYQMKRTRQKGSFTIDLNKYTAETVTMPFDENFGQINCSDCFHQVNLDDPLYRQRELVAFLDGMNASDFGQYINFVNVTMRKKHKDGEQSYDEVRIDRNNFSAEGNNFKLMYGWHGDEDHRNWLDYEYQMTWSFFGGHTTKTDWRRSNVGSISVSPPFQRRAVDLEADPDLLSEAGVRSVTVNLYYVMGGEEKMKQVTLNPRKEQFSERIDLIQPKDELAYDYEIIWRLRGNKTVTSGRQNATESILFVDELPVQ